MIIGLTGTLGAGKGTISDFFTKELGFGHFSFRGFLTEEIERRGLEVNRDNMVAVANELREKNGPAFIAEQLYEQAMSKGQNAVIESLRCPGEVEALRGKPGFLLLAVDADVQTRYFRTQQRASATDDVSYRKFMEDEKKEMSSPEPFKQNIGRCIGMADYFALNDGTVEDLTRKIRETFGEINPDGTLKRRPTYDETFMHGADAASARSTCLSRRTGALIAIDNVSVSDGYNGSPRGRTNCDKRGYCERRKKEIPSGQRLELCFAVHAEVNAVLNAGRKGTSVIGGTMYATTYPCNICAGIIVNSGVSRLVYDAQYAGDLSKEVLETGKQPVIVERFEGVRPRAYTKLFRTALG